VSKQEEPELKFRLETKDGTPWISEMTWQSFKAKLDNLEVTNRILRNELYDVKNRLWILETPQRHQAVLSILKEKPRDENSIERHTKATYGDLQEMMRLGFIIQTKQGTHTMYSLVPEPTRETSK
jgi:hypothetical protein